MGIVIEAVIARTRPEAAYCMPLDGARGGRVCFDMKEPADVARIAETLFPGGDADVEFAPVMYAEDLKKALASL